MLDWLREWMGMPPETEGILVSGGSVGTLTALAAAAHARAEVRDEATGYVQEHTHAARRQGVAGARLQPVEPARAAVRPRAPAAGRRRSTRPSTSTARPTCSRSWSSAAPGTTSTGSVDALNDLADLAAARGHVVPRRRRLRRHPPSSPAPSSSTGSSAPTASSWTRTSGSSSPTRSARCSIRHHTALEQAFALDGAYLRDTGGGVVEFRERGPQLTRSARALKLYLSLKVFGLDAFKAGDRSAGSSSPSTPSGCCSARGGWEVVSPATLGIVCFRRDGATDEQTDAMVRATVADGFAAPSTTILDGRTVARLCTINPRTTNQDIEGTIERMERLSR